MTVLKVLFFIPPQIKLEHENIKLKKDFDLFESCHILNVWGFNELACKKCAQ